jgi:hypothetical protein
MRRNKDKAIAGNNVAVLTHGGHKISPTAMRRALATVNDGRLEVIAKEKIRLHRAGDKPFSKLRPSLGNKNPAVATASERLQKVSKALAKRRVKAPPRAGLQGGLLSAAISLRITPGYDFGDVSSVPHDAFNSSFVHRSYGRMGFRMFAENQDQSAFARVSLGAFFIPMFGPAHLRADVNPSISFAQWVVSTGMTAVTLALLSFRVDAFKPNGQLDANVHSIGTGNTLWFQQLGIGAELDLDTISNPMRATIDVDTNHFYLIRLACLGQAFSQGTDKPGFTASSGGILDLLLPSIDLDVRLIPIVSL